MVLVGHALLGTRGEVLSLDAGYCSILGTGADEIVGRCVLDVTAPADRVTCATLMRDLVATREPFQVSKRFMRSDGSVIWVSNTVSIIAFGDAPPMVVSTIVPIAAPDARTPANLLDCARFLLSSRRDRAGAFDTTMFIEPAWDMMLTAYVAEAEGAALDLDALARAASMSATSAERWVRALIQEGLLETEVSCGPAGPYRLSDRAHQQFEDYLSGLLQKRLPEPHRAV